MDKDKQMEIKFQALDKIMDQCIAFQPQDYDMIQSKLKGYIKDIEREQKIKKILGEE
jgi:hypothetical protein